MRTGARKDFPPSTEAVKYSSKPEPSGTSARVVPAHAHDAVLVDGDRDLELQGVGRDVAIQEDRLRPVRAAVGRTGEEKTVAAVPGVGPDHVDAVPVGRAGGIRGELSIADGPAPGRIVHVPEGGRGFPLRAEGHSPVGREHQGRRAPDLPRALDLARLELVFDDREDERPVGQDDGVDRPDPFLAPSADGLDGAPPRAPVVLRPEDADEVLRVAVQRGDVEAPREASRRQVRRHLLEVVGVAEVGHVAPARAAVFGTPGVEESAHLAFLVLGQRQRAEDRRALGRERDIGIAAAPLVLRRELGGLPGGAAVVRGVGPAGESAFRPRVRDRSADQVLRVLRVRRDLQLDVREVSVARDEHVGADRDPGRRGLGKGGRRPRAARRDGHEPDGAPHSGLFRARGDLEHHERILGLLRHARRTATGRAATPSSPPARARGRPAAG